MFTRVGLIHPITIRRMAITAGEKNLICTLHVRKTEVLDVYETIEHRKDWNAIWDLIRL